MLAHVEQELDPLSCQHWGRLAAYQICRVLTAYLLSHQRGSYPFSYQPGHWGFSLLEALKKDGPGQCSGHSQAPTQNLWKVYVNIVIYFLSSNTIFWIAYPNDYQMIICIVLIVVIFLGLINHITE
jgi:hypothetical protein